MPALIHEVVLGHSQLLKVEHKIQRNGEEKLLEKDTKGFLQEVEGLCNCIGVWIILHLPLKNCTAKV